MSVPKQYVGLVTMAMTYYTLAVFNVQHPFYINLMESKQVFLLMNFLNQLVLQEYLNDFVLLV
jgi:hypothetical protein